MSQTNTNPNTGSGNTNRKQITGKSGRVRGGSGGRGHINRGDDCGGNCGGDFGGNCRNNSITKYSFEGKIKDGCISKLSITKTGHQATQYKKIIDTLLVLCIDKNFRYINDVLCT